MDNETLDNVFNFVFGRYAKLHLVPDPWDSRCWPTFTITGERVGTRHEDLWRYEDLWVGPPELAAEGTLTLLRVNILGEDAAELPVSEIEPIPPSQSSKVTKELCTATSSADPAALRVKRYIAYGVIKLLKQHRGGLAIVEDCDVARKILDVRSLEELLVKANLTA